jgi:hypothetical protein
MDYQIVETTEQREMRQASEKINFNRRLSHLGQEMNFMKYSDLGYNVTGYEALKERVRLQRIETKSLIVQSRLARGLDIQTGLTEEHTDRNGKQFKIATSTDNIQSRVFDRIVDTLPRCYKRLGIKVNRKSIVIYQNCISVTSFRKLVKALYALSNDTKVSGKYDYKLKDEKRQVAESLNLTSGYINIAGSIIKM